MSRRPPREMVDAFCKLAAAEGVTIAGQGTQQRQMKRTNTIGRERQQYTKPTPVVSETNPSLAVPNIPPPPVQ